MSDFSIRPMEPADEPFIFRAWLEGYWPHFPGNLVMRKSEFMERWHRVIERILADPQTRTVVAHVEGKPEALLGFACAAPVCVHWCYVKQPYRGLGIAQALLAKLNRPRTCTHWSTSLYTRETWGPDWKYAPHLLKEYTP